MRRIIAISALLAAGLTAVAVGAGRKQKIVRAPDLSGPPIRSVQGDPPGVRVRSDPARGEENLHAAISQWFSASQAVPPQRVEHFRWIDEDKYPVAGWNVKIEEAQATPTGWIADVRVTPRIEGVAAITHLYAVRERYESVNGRVNLLGVEAVPGSIPGFITD